MSQLEMRREFARAHMLHIHMHENDSEKDRERENAGETFQAMILILKRAPISRRNARGKATWNIPHARDVRLPKFARNA